MSYPGRCLVFLLEERSAKEFLDGFLSRQFPELASRDEIDIVPITFEGKSDLEKNIVRKIKHWQRPNTDFVILRDLDSGDCRKIKMRLRQLCQDAGRTDVLIRIACQELESWYLGDLAAVDEALGTNVARLQEKRKYRSPDHITRPSDELRNLTDGQYRKIAGSRLLGHIMRKTTNRSHSFRVFVDGIERLLKT